ncbi:MAG TPA: carbohydrate kinase [Phycisphaerae bacterium]|nr:carbohydrate kinase [Phycisphaerae bacterium]
MTDQPFQLVGIGELLWDCFENQRKPGGAPANVAFHANQLGMDATVVTRVGTDPLGAELIGFLDGHNLDTHHIQSDPTHPTGTVTVDMVRADHPQYTIHENVAWDHIEFSEALRATCSSTHAICFGTLAQRSPVSKKTIQDCIGAAADAIKIYDVNLRPPYYDRPTIEASLNACDIAKFNDEESVVLAEMLELSNPNLESFAAALRDRYKLDAVCITKGGDGSLIVTKSESASAPSPKITVADTVGAGDSFTAAVAFAQLHGWNAQATATFANQIAGNIAANEGAMPRLDRNVIEEIIASAKGM